MGTDWTLLFLATIWGLHGKQGMAQSKMYAWDTEESFHGIHLDPMTGRWFKPPPGYVDGNVRNGPATFSGVLRNHEGKWVWGFAGSCGFSSPLGA